MSHAVHEKACKPERYHNHRNEWSPQRRPLRSRSTVNRCRAWISNQLWSLVGVQLSIHRRGFLSAVCSLLS